jgi:hypothetical protein
MANSSTVSVNDQILASQYNDLRADVLDSTTGHGHTEAADDGKPLYFALNYIIGDGINSIEVGLKGFLEIPFAATIKQWTLMADQAGDIVIDIWKDTYANFPPTDADTITGANEPSLSAAQKAQDSTLTGWTTSISAGDILAFNVDSAATVTQVTLALKMVRGI